MPIQLQEQSYILEVNPMKTLWWIGAWVVLGMIEQVWAVDKGFSKALKRIEIKGSGSRGTSSEYIVPILLGIGAVLLVVALYRVIENRKKIQQARPKVVDSGPDFKERAAQIGFQRAEVRLLKVLAERVSPHNIAQVLETDAGRHKLASEVVKRVHRRERELLVLRGISEKLGMAGHMKARETLRVEAHLSVWIVPQLSSEEEEWEEVEQVDGQLLDLSEGGAALCVQSDLAVGDLIEFWSADAQVWLAPTAARVLRIEAAGNAAAERVFHLQFIDPPTEELRGAIRALQLEEAQARGGVKD
ncbi:MAG: hypothetical protein ACI906_002975 [Candidatus Latescibacterota bacterium]